MNVKKKMYEQYDDDETNSNHEYETNSDEDDG